MKGESDGTRGAYGRDVNEFFNYLGKDIRYLTVNDIQLHMDDVIKYQWHLKTKVNANSNSSINRKVTTITQLYKRFHNGKYVSDLVAFNMVERLKQQDNSYGILAVDEVFTMADIVMTQKTRGRDRRLSKRNLILMSLDTCLRKSAILNIKWSDFSINGDFVEFTAIDKNGAVNKQIKISFYNQLLAMREIEGDNTEYVFNLHPNTVDNMMNWLRNEMELPESRNIVFHSIRKAGVTFQYRISNDILQAMEAAGHKNVNTTQIYLKSRSYGNLGAVSNSIDEDMDLIKLISHEDLLKTLDALPIAEKMIIIKKIKELNINLSNV
ncbi:tyrosine-type recombinase/integrase [Streptomyces sp. NPDC057927]